MIDPIPHIDYEFFTKAPAPEGPASDSYEIIREITDNMVLGFNKDCFIYDEMRFEVISDLIHHTTIYVYFGDKVILTFGLHYSYEESTKDCWETLQHIVGKRGIRCSFSVDSTHSQIYDKHT